MTEQGENMVTEQFGENEINDNEKGIVTLGRSNDLKIMNVFLDPY